MVDNRSEARILKKGALKIGARLSSWIENLKKNIYIYILITRRNLKKKKLKIPIL